MSNGERQCHEVVYGADEHDPQADPDEAGEPAERLNCQDRTGDRTGGSDGGEVLPEEIKRWRGDEILAVMLFV